jgi:HAMP domain-containing protein
MNVECFKDHLSLKGVSISRSGAGIFGVAPVRDGAGEIGVFEFGLDFAPLLDGLKAQYGFDVALYIEEQPLRATATNLPGDVFTDENRVGKYIRVHTTHLERMRQLVTDRDLSGGGEQKYVREAGGLPYGVLVIPVRNYAGKELGVIAIAGDFAGSRAASSETVAWQALITLFGIVVCVGAILVVLRGMVLRPLREVGEKLQALASGNHEAAIEGADEMCEELQELAAAHETLRTKAASNSEPATQEET